MDAEERAYCESLIQTALSSLEVAKGLMKVGAYEAVVFYAALAGENAANALIVALGGRPSRRHRADIALHTYFRTRGEEMPVEVEQVVEKLKWLKPHVTISRYPIKVGGKWVPPANRYRKGDAERALEYAKAIVRVAEQRLKRKSTTAS